ncbi:MAG: AraC family transcriptional regulator [Hyphomicrobiales bacterium]|nr:AraC family transcriptional regulator [Hyphomicrobiales bacterium]
MFLFLFDVGLDAHLRLCPSVLDDLQIYDTKFGIVLKTSDAARLLLEGKPGVARVAQQVGYSSRSHFTQQLEARYGVSLARYGKSDRS